MKEQEIRSILTKYNQEHLLNFYEELSEQDKNKLLSQIDSIDWSFTDYLSNGNRKKESIITPIDAVSLDKIELSRDKYYQIGVETIKSGKLCLLLLAGGQGTRLGYDKPKGAFNMGINKDLFIFQLLIEHTLKIVNETDTWIHLFIMTSDINHDDTVSFFNEHNNFGYKSEYLHFFIQEMNPATDFNGKILMSSPSSIALSPNGNGGWFSTMENAGLIDKITDLNIEWINVFAVDNVLQGIADPVFLGATLAENKTCGAKVVRKASPDEKVGAICLENNKPHIIEYYELSEEMRNQKNPDGSLAYGFGVTLNYLFPIKNLHDTLKLKMPLHRVKKSVPYIDSNKNMIQPSEPNGYKFETLALDLIHEMDDCMVFEVDREKEFAPVKNKSGVDSIDTARELLTKNGYEL
ncbi:MAG: UDPGP type 1 family protein [Lachnospiraceae bacterium]|nr:UDPGP type 1 family protein [Lachnospiraceae bacterium]